MSAAAAVAAALGARAEDVCRRYLPHGRKQGRYWTAGDARGARGRSLFVRLAPPGVPGKWTDASTGEHGDLLDLIRIASGAGSLRAALAEARAFLAAPPGSSAVIRTATTAPRRPAASGSAAAPSTAPMPKPISGRVAFSAAASRRCAFTLRCSIATTAACAACLRWSPPSPPTRRTLRGNTPVRVTAPLTAPSAACLRTWLDPVRPTKANLTRPRKALGRVHGRAVHFGEPACGTLLVGEGIETVLSIVTAMPDTVAAAALSAGSLGAFAPPAGVTRLVIARDNDPEGECAAERLVRRCARMGVDAMLVVPDGGDFNDELLAHGTAALAARLAPLFRVPARVVHRT